jgi:hypothetical protein
MTANDRDLSPSSPDCIFPLERICSTCGVQRPWAEFAVDRSKACGHKSICKGCDSKRSLARYYARRSGSQRAARRACAVCASRAMRSPSGARWNVGARRVSWLRDDQPLRAMLATDLELPATTHARLTGHADAGFTLRVYARDERKTKMSWRTCSHARAVRGSAPDRVRWVRFRVRFRRRLLTHRDGDGVPKRLCYAACRFVTLRVGSPGVLAMQKVVGSSPIIRFF